MSKLIETIRAEIRSQLQVYRVVSGLLMALTNANDKLSEGRPFDRARAQVMHLLFLVMAQQRHRAPIVPGNGPRVRPAEDLLFSLTDWEPGLVLCGKPDVPLTPSVEHALREFAAAAGESTWSGELLGSLLDRVDIYAKAHGENGAQARYERRYGGAYYTNQRLVKTVVRETLKPMLERCRSATDLLSLRVIDPAVGGANFLVEALRQLAQTLNRISGEALDSCVRQVLERCIYGVDVDPLAVTAARCALWLEAERCGVGALQRHIIVGDSLVGDLPEGVDGFDAVVGNPPWNKMKADLKEFYGHYDPAVLGMQGSQLRQYVETEFACKPMLQRQWTEHQRQVQLHVRQLLKSPNYIHVRATNGGRVSGGDSDMYKFFLERACQLARRGGRVGLVLPAALCTAEGAAGLRRMLLKETRIDALVTVENRDRTFPIDSRFKYAVLVAERGSGPTTVIPSRYMAASVDQLTIHLSERDLLRVPVETLNAISPKNQTFVDVREPLEIELLERLHSRFPALGAEVPGSWKIRFVRELDMTNDSGLFEDNEGLSKNGYWREQSGRFRNPEGHEYVPLMEGRMVHQFDHAFKAYVGGHGRKAVWRQLPWTDKQTVAHYYVERGTADRATEGAGPRAGYCDVTGQTNERTVLAALIPAESVAGNKVPTIRIDDFEGDATQVHLLWIAIANSFVVDWLMRVRMSTTINFFHWHQIPFPRLLPSSPEAAELISAAAELSAERPVSRKLCAEAQSELSDQNVREERVRQHIRAEIDARVAALYGLSVLEYAYILSTFPLLDRHQHPLPGDHGTDGRPRSYITRDLALLAYCRHTATEPPGDIVDLYRGVGVDIEELTGKIRNLEERVERGLDAGAFAYVPTGTRPFG